MSSQTVRASLGSPWLHVLTMLVHRPLVTTTKDKHNHSLSRLRIRNQESGLNSEQARADEV